MCRRTGCAIAALLHVAELGKRSQHCIRELVCANVVLLPGVRTRQVSEGRRDASHAPPPPTARTCRSAAVSASTLPTAPNRPVMCPRGKRPCSSHASMWHANSSYALSAGEALKSSGQSEEGIITQGTRLSSGWRRQNRCPRGKLLPCHHHSMWSARSTANVPHEQHRAHLGDL